MGNAFLGELVNAFAGKCFRHFEHGFLDTLRYVKGVSLINRRKVQGDLRGWRGSVGIYLSFFFVQVIIVIMSDSKFVNTGERPPMSVSLFRSALLNHGLVLVERYMHTC